MPDLLTHIAVGGIAAQTKKLQPWLPVFLAGCVLPDLATRPFYIIWPDLYWFVKVSHTPVGILLLCGFLAGLFAHQQRRPVFLALLAGSGLHLAMDLLQRHIAGGYALLFPFSWRPWPYGLIWPEQSLWLLPLWLALVLVFLIRWRRQNWIISRLG